MLFVGVVALKARPLIAVTMPVDYMNKIEDVLLDELEIAQNKWGLRLSKDDVNSVKKHSLNQVTEKFATTFKCQWGFEPVAKIKLKGVSFYHEPKEVIALDRFDENTYLVIGKQGLEVDDEIGEDAFLIKDFTEHLMNIILKWTRTAVFYGVGSFR